MSRIVVAAYDYDATDDTQISFKEGDQIEVIEEDESGWYMGRLKDGSEGYFPATYIEGADEDEDVEDEDENANDDEIDEDANNIEDVVLNDDQNKDEETHTPLISTNERTDTNAIVEINSEQKEPIAAYQIEPDNANDEDAEIAGGLEQISKTDNEKQQSTSLLKSDYRKAKTSNSTLIDATSENYYSSNLLNLKYNPNSKSRYGLASYYMTYCTAFSSFMMGLAAFSWYHGSKYIYENSITSQTLCMITGFYCFFGGILIFIWNVLYGKQRKLSRIPLRSIAYFVVAIVPFLTYVTAIIGVMWLITCIFSMLAWKNGEEYLYTTGDRKNEIREEWNEFKLCCSMKYWKEWYYTIKTQSELKIWLFYFVYTLFNLIYCLYQFAFYVDQVNALNGCAETACPEGAAGFDGATLSSIAAQNGNGFVVSMLLPIAKFMGNLLDINCAFILFPVCRSFITKLYNISTDQRSTAKCCNFILSFIPLDKAIDLHIYMSFLIVIGATVHTWGHYLHYSQVPVTYHEVFGNTVWISGAIIVVVMMLIYCTSLSAVRHGKYELFWYTHHLFVVFFVATIFHGRQGFGPNFWKWMIVPGILYILERMLREYHARKAVGVISICHMNNEKAKIYCIELEKVHHIKTFYEGQYVFLKSPIISKFQWHPFTISSPPEQKTLTIHIRNMGPGSWTDRLQTYFAAMSPNKCYTELYHRNGNYLEPQTIGPDGKNLICIDGPISAPTQHLGEYLTCLVIGAGIGVTPMRAALQSIVYYRFKRGIGHSYPDNAYCVWIVNYKQLAAYRWMCRTLKEVEDEMYDMRTKNKEMEDKKIEIHIFVTSVPENINMEENNELELESMNDDNDLAVWGTHFDDLLHENKLKDDNNKVKRHVNAPFEETHIWKALKIPPKNDEETKIGDIIIHRGRPKWDQFFLPIQKEHSGQNIGVMFCGPHVIAKDLQVNCGKFTDLPNKTRFVLHKENY